ncbi:MAG: glycine cleavage system protein GcvH [Candidatus Odinarchaeota archaeon]
MSKIPENLRFSKEHEWVEKLDDGNVKIGITDYAQAKLKDIVFVDLSDISEGDEIETGTEFGAIESVKAVSDLFAPISGEIVSINEELEDAPETVNSDPYGAWMIIVKPGDDFEEEYTALFDAAGYEEFIKE